MASLIGSLYVSLTADYSAFQRNLRAAGGVVETTSAGMRRNMGLTERSVSSFQRSVSGNIRPFALISAARAFDTVNQRANLLRGALFATTAAFGGLGAAITSNIVSRYLDSFTGLENQIRVVSNGSADLAAQIELVGKVADRSRSSLQATATLYSRIAKARPEDGAIATLRRVETISKALQLGGATAQESSSAAIQLSQAIASNRLGGEELRAVLETPLGLELAKGLGVTIGKFREMGYAGELTAEVVLGALDKISSRIDKQFANSIQTIDQALTVVDGKITKFAGSLDDTYGITKLITGGLISFGNNLDMIASIAGTVGLALGAAFAGRGLGRFSQNRIDSVRKEIDARKALLKVAEDDFAASKRAAAEANKALRSQGPQSPVLAADPAAKKELAQATAAERKINRERLANVDAQIAARQRLNDISVTSSKSAIRAADSLAAAEARVSQEVQNRTNLYKQRTRLNREINTLSAQTSERDRRSEASSAALNDALRRRTELTKQIEVATGRVVDARQKVTERTIALTNLETAAEQKAANERLAARRKLIELDRQSADLQSRQQAQRVRVFQATTAVEISGQRAISEAARKAAINSAEMASSVNVARERLVVATKATSLFSTGIGLIRAAGGSLVSFLGGPWGVAFTAAMALVTLWGIKTRAAAEKVAEAQRIIQEEIQRAGDDQNLSTPEDERELLSTKLQEENRRLGIAKDRLKEVVQEITDAMRIEAAYSGEGSAKLVNDIVALKAELDSGKITVQQFLDRLRQLGVSGDSLKTLEENVNAVSKEAARAERAIELINIRVKELDGQIANVNIRINAIDPLGIFKTDKNGNPLTNPNMLFAGVSDRKNYGIGQESMREEIEMLTKRNAILREAVEINKVLNTPQKISNREQELLEQGYARTREEAKALATEELNLAEKTRVAGQSAGSAAKEHENFKNKIAELKETASGAFLSDLDKKVLDFTDSLKNGAELMRQYIEAINSGDLSKAPAQLLEVRDALLQIGAADMWDEILTKYGTGAQLSAKFAEEQAKLAILVEKGAITAAQAKEYWNDYITQFGEYEWINSVSDAIANFAEQAITDFDNVGEAAANLAKQLLKIALDMLVLDPFKNWLKGILGGLAGLGGGGGGIITDLKTPSLAPQIAPMLGGSKQTSMASKMMAVPASAFSAYPSMHDMSLSGGSMSGIFERGESAMNGGGASMTPGAIEKMTSRIGGGSSMTDARVFNIDARGAQRGVAEEIRDALKEYDKSNTIRVAAGFAKARQRRLIR